MAAAVIKLKLKQYLIGSYRFDDATNLNLILVEEKKNRNYSWPVWFQTSAGLVNAYVHCPMPDLVWEKSVSEAGEASLLIQ